MVLYRDNQWKIPTSIKNTISFISANEYSGADASLNLNVVQLFLLESFLLSLQEVRNQVVGVFLRLHRFTSWQQLVRQRTLVSSNHSEVTGVKLVFRQSGNGLLCDRVFFDNQIIEPKRVSIQK